MDLRGGRAVRAGGGRRAEYAPFDADPLALARQLVTLTGATTLYVADLDAIERTGSNRPLWEAFAADLGVTVAVDAGLRTAADADAFPTRPRLVPVAGSETLAGPAAAEALRGRPSLFSVDLSAGRLIGDWQAGGVADATDAAGVARAGHAATRAVAVILLDLARVGGRAGPADVTAPRAALPAEIPLWVGGGVRNRADLAQLAKIGVAAALVSTALHDGGLP
jgi:uncharacterized protein related to proFAR isomerase